MAIYDVFLNRGGRYLAKKDVSVRDSGEYMRWIAETLASSFDRKRRPPYRLLIELIPMLMKASRLAEKGDREGACDAVLCGLGLKVCTNEDTSSKNPKSEGAGACPGITDHFGITGPESEKKGGTQGKGRRPAASLLEVVAYMDRLKKSNDSMSGNALAQKASSEFKISVSTAKRYWKKYKDTIKE